MFQIDETCYNVTKKDLISNVKNKSKEKKFESVLSQI